MRRTISQPRDRRPVGTVRILLATLSVAASCSVGLAQSPADVAGGGSEEMILFQDLPSVFGASKYEQKSSEAPASVSIITADEIQRYGYRSLFEILRSVRGLFTTYDRNYSYIGVRGFDRPGDYDTRVLFLLDGHRMNDNIYEQASIGTESPVDVDVIDHVEIIRGPSSSLYGTNAFLAVINVVTRSGRDFKGGEFTAEGGSYSTAKGSVAYGAKLDRGVEILLSGSAYGSGGQRLYYPEFDTPATNNGLAEKADGDQYNRVLAKLSSGNLNLEAVFSSRLKGIPTASFGTTFDDSRAQTLDQRSFFNLRYDREVGSQSRLVTTASFDSYRYQGAYPYPASLLRDYGYGQWWSAETQSISTIARRHKVIAGAEVRFNTQQDQGAYDSSPSFTYFKDSRTSKIWALYAQDEFSISDHFVLNAGVRHDDYDTFGNTTNPRVAAIFGPHDTTTLKLMYGRAFRAPNAYELYYDDGGISQKANPNGLAPELIQTYEAALEHSFHGGLRGVLSIYQYRIRNLISAQIDPLDGLSFFANVDRVRARGVEAEVEGKIARHLDARISYAYQNSEDASTGLTLTNSPRQIAKLNVTAPVAGDRLQAGVEVQYVSRRDTVLGNPAGAYSITNLTLLSHRWKRGPSVSASVYNLFDRKYGDPVGDEFNQTVIPQDGRNFRVQVKYEF